MSSSDVFQIYPSAGVGAILLGMSFDDAVLVATASHGTGDLVESRVPEMLRMQFPGLMIKAYDGLIDELIVTGEEYWLADSPLRVGVTWAEVTSYSSTVLYDESYGAWHFPRLPGLWISVSSQSSLGRTPDLYQIADPVTARLDTIWVSGP